MWWANKIQTSNAFGFHCFDNGGSLLDMYIPCVSFYAWYNISHENAVSQTERMLRNVRLVSHYSPDFNCITFYTIQHNPTLKHLNIIGTQDTTWAPCQQRISKNILNMTTTYFTYLILTPIYCFVFGLRYLVQAHSPVFHAFQWTPLIY